MESAAPLPRAVRRQVERAKEMERLAQQPQEEQAQPEKADNAEQQQEAQQGVEAKSQDVTQEQRPQQPSQQDGKQQPPDQRENDPAYWKQRFSSLQGILRREREDHLAEVKRLTEEIVALKAELDKAKEAGQSSIDLSEYLTAEQIEALGEDKAAEMVMLARKVAENEVKRRVESALAPVQRMQQHEQEARSRRMAQAFHDALSEAVPQWQEINKSEEWLVFCGEEDERTGMVRQSIIDWAQSRWDARPIIALLKDFLARSGMNAKRPSEPPVSPQPSAANGRQADVPEQSAAPPMTPAELKRRYTEIATNRRLTDEQRRQRLAELDSMYRQSQERWRQ